MQHILKCPQCKNYTMKDICKCGAQAINTKPQRYSPDKYAKYRRQAKKDELIKKGLL